MDQSEIYLHVLKQKIVFPYNNFTFTLQSNVYDPSENHNLIGFVTQIALDQRGVQQRQGLSIYGTLLKIEKSELKSQYKLIDKKKIYSVSYIGLVFARFKVLKLSKSTKGRFAKIHIFDDGMQEDNKNTETQNLKKQLSVYYKCLGERNEIQSKSKYLKHQQNTNKIIFRTINEIKVPLIDKIKLLQINHSKERIEYFINLLTSRTENIKYLMEHQNKVYEEMTLQQKKNQKVILNSILGNNKKDFGDIKNKIKEKKMPKYVKAEIQSSIKGIDNKSEQSDAKMKYIEILLSIPWCESNPQNINLLEAKKVIDQDHTGLQIVKERILQFLAVKLRNGNSKGNIICLHGPPGVGKTSIAHSIARSMGRQFQKVYLGGLSDQSQLRGHRRTYISSMPGAIINALIKAKSNNPVILLDQIEKIGKNGKGNPEHALLELLDPNQNSSFVDHYISLPVDLSKVMFICTANNLQLSSPLLNRLELIQISGYSRQQKYEIAKNHLLSGQIRQNGVKDLIQFEEDALKEIIKRCDDFGVRELERKIACICRKVAKKEKKQVITVEKVEEILGKRTQKQLWSGLGVVNGIGFSQNGSKVMPIEALKYQCTDPCIQLTGQLGQVACESTQIASSWLQSNSHELQFLPGSSFCEDFNFNKHSLHIHLPQGSTKKDGASFGLPILVCLSSLFTNIPVREKLAMVGQITLSGKILPVKRVKQKCISAIYEGIKHIILPFDNTNELEKIDEKLKKDVTFYPLKQVREALAISFASQIDKHQFSKL